MLTFWETTGWSFLCPAISAPAKSPVLHRIPCTETMFPAQGPTGFKRGNTHTALFEGCKLRAKFLAQNPYKWPRFNSVHTLFLDQEVSGLSTERQVYPEEVFLYSHLVFIFFFFATHYCPHAGGTCIALCIKILSTQEEKKKKKKESTTSLFFFLNKNKQKKWFTIYFLYLLHPKSSCHPRTKAL